MPLGRDAQLFEVTAVIKREADIDAVRREIDRTIEQFQTQPVDPAKLARVKRHEKYALLMAMDSPAAVAGALAPFVGVAAASRPSTACMQRRTR